MMHGDAHPGNFMLMPDGRLAVIDFGAIAPLPDGMPVEMGMMIRLARERQYDLLLPTMEKIGFVQKGEQLSIEAIDEMLAQYVEPIEVPVFHYTRKWLQKHAAENMERAPQQLKMARQMDLPVNLAMPLRVIASNVAISCQLDCHVPVREMAERLIPGFAEPEPTI
jgi:predicted unusual protein kinase regulating ubiquinone biosynthesis (AarF/ABC1/UbiB family)